MWTRHVPDGIATQDGVTVQACDTPARGHRLAMPHTQAAVTAERDARRFDEYGDHEGARALRIAAAYHLGVAASIRAEWVVD